MEGNNGVSSTLANCWPPAHESLILQGGTQRAHSGIESERSKGVDCELATRRVEDRRGCFVMLSSPDVAARVSSWNAQRLQKDREESAALGNERRTVPARGLQALGEM